MNQRAGLYPPLETTSVKLHGDCRLFLVLHGASLPAHPVCSFSVLSCNVPSPRIWVFYVLFYWYEFVNDYFLCSSKCTYIWTKQKVNKVVLIMPASSAMLLSVAAFSGVREQHASVRSRVLRAVGSRRTMLRERAKVATKLRWGRGLSSVAALWFS